MENLISRARKNFSESWFVFSMTGNLEDARMFINDLATYDGLLAKDEEMELE